MTISVNPNELKSGDGGDYVKETEVIPDGFNVCRLVSYIEMGHHNPMFKGKHNTYDAASKKAGQLKPPEMVLHLVFEFPQCEYTGSFPLCIKTSIPFGDGEFINKLAVPPSLEEGWGSFSMFKKSKYGKLLLALRDATKIDSWSVSDFIGSALGCTVTHNLGAKADEEGNIPVYANMKLDSIVAPEMKHPMTRKVEVLDVPDAIGEYCSVFDWENPCIDAWGKVPPFIKDCMKNAIDYSGSPLEMMLLDYTEDTASDVGVKNTETKTEDGLPE